ncbi:MAG: arabinogalactan oligomer / maltooligosaccharide transport system substrate-binding protein [Acidobacteriota bacterium]|jgi:arabinogalactan oligomer/maltooligosaccharide transport system substrate-binding protein|nr:arabinogalactan oligomer / maltooligosaccharide transport system substrate-binding protein [Acidobacteriota bacterium]
MRFKFVRALGALALFLAVPVIALAQAKEVVVWHGYRGGEKAAFEQVIENFNKVSAGKIHVSSLAVPYDAFADKITAAVPRGKGPDVFIFAQDRLGGWIAAGNTVEPLDFFLDPAIKGRYLKATLDAMTYQGTTYGLPLDFKVITLIYNKKLVPVPPKTTAELEATAKKLTSAGAGKFGLAYAYSDFYYHAALMNGFGGGVFGPNRKPTLNSPQNVASFDYLLKWQAMGFLPAEPSTALITSLFNDGKAAMVFSGPWFLGEIAKGVDYGLAPLPTISEAGNKPIRPWITVEGVYVAAPSKVKDAAFEFAKYLTDVPAAKVLALQGRQTPANKGVYADPQVAADPILKAFRQQVDVAVPMPNLPEMSMVWTPATTAMNVVVKRAATPKAALDQAQKEVIERINSLLKK